MIYAPYVTDTAITFETEPPQPAEMADRIATAMRTHAWVVLQNQGAVVGYAYGGRYHSRAAAVAPFTTRCSTAWPSAASAPQSRA